MQNSKLDILADLTLTTKKEIKNAHLYRLLSDAGLPLPLTEYRFYPSRKWRADYCWPEEKVILEVEGGVWVGGRHTRGKGFLNDMEKYNQAVVLGYRLLRCTPGMIEDGSIIESLLALFAC